MVCKANSLPPIEFPKGTDPRDWSHLFGHGKPPVKGEACYVVMLVGVRKKARWQPRTIDALPPLVLMLGACVFTWTHSREQAVRDVRQFNGNQLRGRYSKPHVTLWAVLGWGVCGFDATVRVVEGGAL